jgi:hypothetical protein
LLAVPAMTLLNAFRERAFAKKWGRSVLEGVEPADFGAKRAQESVA